MPSTPPERSPFVVVAGLNEEVAPLVARGAFEPALATVFDAADHALRTTQLRGQAIYLPGLDPWVQQIGRTLTAGSGLRFAAGERVLVIASELYEFGGHSRVVADICRILDPKPVVVLTDIFGRYAAGRRDWSRTAWLLPSTTVAKLPATDLVTKVRNLLRTIAAVKPRAIFLFAHHQDVVAYAAANAAVPIAQWFFHHADHHPSLGATVEHYRHLDFTRELQSLCARCTGRRARYVPLFAPDQGARTFAYPLSSISTVSSGAFNKYATEGPLAYHELVGALLSGAVRRHHHIGAIPPEYLEALRRALAGRGIDSDRFVHLTQVESLWATLLSLDAQVYVASAPVGGGRTAVEVLGAGYPAVHYAGEQGPFLRVRSLYPAECPTFDSAASLVEAVRAVGENHARISKACRAYYLAQYAEQAFRRAIEEGGLD